MWTKLYWQRVAERFIRAFATAFVLTASAVEVINGDLEVELKDRLLIGLVQGIGAVALSLAGAGIGDHTSPSLLPSPPEKPLDSEGNLER